MRSQLGVRRPKQTRISLDLTGLFQPTNRVRVIRDAATIELLPSPFMNTMTFTNRRGRSVTFNSYIAALCQYGKSMLPNEEGISAPFIGHFLFAEHEPEVFSAHAMLMGAELAVPLFKNIGALKKVKKHTLDETFYAAALITYEEWLGAKPVSECLIEHERQGKVHHFSFGQEFPKVREILNASFSNAVVKQQWLHTAN